MPNCVYVNFLTAAQFFIFKNGDIMDLSVNYQYLFQNMDDQQKKEERLTAIETQQKLGLGVKILLTAIVIGAVAAGIYAAVALSN